MLVKFAIKDFIDDREFKNISNATILRYKNALNEIQNYFAENEVINVNEVTPNLIKKYLSHCKNERGNNPSTLNTKLRTMKTFFNYMVEIEVIEEKRAPTKKFRYMVEDTKIEVFSDYQISEMLNYYRRMKQREKSFYAYRDYSLIVFLLGTGCRLGEAINLKWNQVNFEHGSIIVYGKKRKQTSVPLSDKLLKELAEYKIFCEQKFHTKVDYVFCSTTNQQLSANAIKCLFKRLKGIMNFTDVRLSAHTFRHTFAHRFLMAGGDVFSLQKMLRHEKLDMTMKYVSIWGTALKEQNDRFNPLNNLDI